MSISEPDDSAVIRAIFESISAKIRELDTGSDLPSGFFDIDTITKDWTQSDDDGIFENMAVCSFAGGMKVTTLQQKWEAMREAFGNFKIDYVAGLNSEILLGNSMIIRHPGKVRAQIANAKKVQAIQKDEGSLVNYLSERLCKGLEHLLECVVRDFAFLGPATGADFLKDLGMGGFKPDVHVMRILQRLGLWNGTAESLPESIRRIERATELSAPDIDRLLFRYGSGHKLRYPVCGGSPVCDTCLVDNCPSQYGTH